MKDLLELEEFLLFGLSLFLSSLLAYAWGWYTLFFLAPGLSMLGYLANPRGAWTNNLIHHERLPSRFMFWVAYSPSSG